MSKMISNALRRELAAATGAGLIGFQQSGAGAAERTVQDKGLESITPQDFMTPQQRMNVFLRLGTIDVGPAINAAIDAVGLAGGGQVYMPPGRYGVDNTNAGATNWDNRRAIYFRFDETNLIGAGRGATVIRLLNGANAHVIKFGLRVDGTPLPVHRCSVSRLTIDGNRDNQVVPDATDNHQNAIDVSSNCTGIAMKELHLKECCYYGIGFQRAGFAECVIDDVLIERTGADGLDWKDDDNNNRGNVATKVTVREFGLVAGLTLQSGYNVRGGVKGSDIEVTDFGGDKHAIRIDVSTNPNQSSVRGFFVKATERATTKGVYINATSVTERVQVSGGRVYGMNRAIDAAGRFAQLSSIEANDCDVAFRFYQSNFGDNLQALGCGLGYEFTDDTNVLTNASAINCSTGAQFNAGAGMNVMRGGLFSGNTTNVVDNGTDNAIGHVPGIRTHSVGTANVPIDSTGTKAVTIAHNLDFTPSLDNVLLSLKRNTNVGDLSIGFMWVYNADATNVYCNVRVLTASATAGATVTLVANCIAKKAARQ